MYKLTRNPGFIKGVILKSISNQTPFYMTYCTNRPPQPLPQGAFWSTHRPASEFDGMDQRCGRTWRGDSLQLAGWTWSVGKIAGAWWVWVGYGLGCAPCQKGCHRHQQDCVRFFGGGGGGNPIFFVEVLEKQFREWRDVWNYRCFLNTRFGMFWMCCLSCHIFGLLEGRYVQTKILPSFTCVVFFSRCFLHTVSCFRW